MDKFLHYGALGLVLALSILTYRLLSSEQKRNKPRKIIINTIYVFMAFAIIVMLVGIIAEFLKNPENIKTLGQNNIKIEVKDELTKKKLKSLNNKDYIINISERYFLSKPQIENSVIKTNNINEYLKKIKFHSTNNPNFSEIKESDLNSSSYGQMIYNLKVCEIVFGHPHEIKIIKPIDDYLFKISEKLGKLDEDLDAIDNNLNINLYQSKSELTKPKEKKEILFDTITSTFQNKITISTYDLNRYKGKDFTLENFFFTIFGNILSDPENNIYNLKTTKNSIGLYLNVTTPGVFFDNEQKEMRVDTWIIIYKNDKKIHCIEMKYSPETRDSIDLWSKMKSVVDSFGIIE